MRRLRRATSASEVRAMIERDGEYAPEPMLRGRGTAECEHCHLDRMLRDDGLCRECARLLGAPPS